MSEIRRDLVIVGDDACGKTCLLIAFAKGTYPEKYVPRAFDNYVADVEVDGKHVDLGLWDSSGTGGYNRLRELIYQKADVVLICFAVDSPDSLNDVQEKWISDVKHFCPKVPILLVGCKKDLGRDPRVIVELEKTKQRPVTPEEGMAVAQKIGAKYYLECSAKTGEGVLEVFQYATRMTMSTPTKSTRWSRVVKRASAIINVARPSTPERASTSSVREDDADSSNPSLSTLRSSAPSSLPQSLVLPTPQPSPIAESPPPLPPQLPIPQLYPIAESPAREASSTVSDNDFLKPLKAFNSVVKGLADIHPYAKVALSVLSWASQAMLVQANQDKSIQELQSRIADVYEFMLEDGRLENLISMPDILPLASQVVYECAKFIQVYSQPNFCESATSAMM
ncbi:P-loop containing nucleoside triphosphate hydrolase protein [Amanita muscaria]